MKILVSGATGFLGGALCKVLESRGNEVLRLDSKNCDLTKQSSLNVCNHQHYDQIFHLAAWTQAGDFCLYHPGEQWIINQQINTNMLAWWQQHQPQAKLICIGSSCSYAEDQELYEENYLVGIPIESLFTYAMAKRMLYVGLLALQKQYGLKFLYIVPSTLYGPNYHMHGRQLHFIFDLIRKIVRGKLNSEPVVLWGDGNQRRELVYLDDFIRIMLTLNEKCVNDIINIGAGEECTIRHFAKLICKRVGYDFGAIQFDTSRYVGAKSKVLSVKKLRRILPGLKMTPLEVGLEQTINWFMLEQVKL